MSRISFNGIAPPTRAAQPTAASQKLPAAPDTPWDLGCTYGTGAARVAARGFIIVARCAPEVLQQGIEKAALAAVRDAADRLPTPDIG